MNALLRERGYLDGTPGSYSLTDKGKKYGKEEDHHRGVGGYSWYNRDWTTRTWDEEILTALAGEMDDDHLTLEPTDGPPGETDLDETFAVPGKPYFDSDDDHKDSGASPPLWLSVAFLVGVGIAVNPRVRRWVSGTAKPRVMRMFRKGHDIESADATREVGDVEESVTDPEESTPSD